MNNLPYNPPGPTPSETLLLRYSSYGKEIHFVFAKKKNKNYVKQKKNTYRFWQT